MLDRTLPGIQNLKHIVVLMMENRSFDHMLGALRATNPAIDGLAGSETNPDSTDVPVTVSPTAEYQSQLDPDPDHHFPAADLQIFGGVTTAQNPNRAPNMQGFVKSYFNQEANLGHSHLIMNYFTPQMLPCLTGLATEFAVFNRWFSSIPGPTLCNRAFAHWGTSFGQVSMNIFYWNKQYLSIYERLFSRGQHHQALLLRRSQLLARSRQPAAEPALALRHIPGLPRRLQEQSASAIQLHRAQLHRPRRARWLRRTDRLRSASRPRRARG